MTLQTFEKLFWVINNKGIWQKNLEDILLLLTGLNGS